MSEKKAESTAEFGPSPLGEDTGTDDELAHAGETFNWNPAGSLEGDAEIHPEIAFDFADDDEVTFEIIDESTEVPGDAIAGSRREGRERAIAILYEAELKNSNPNLIMKETMVSRNGFVSTIIGGISGNSSRIDQLIEGNSVGWALDRMPLIDLIICRVAAFELLESADIPIAVILDEAIELARKYSTEGSGRFVNGILAAIAEQVRQPQG